MSDTIDGCTQGEFRRPPHATNEEVELWPLFAEALDPNSPVTIVQAERDWKELFGAPPH